jgi:CheY-like chemotaxis protein
MTKIRQILIIEDNADDQLLLLRQLRNAGLAQHIKIISNGGEALHYLKDENLKGADLAAIFLDLKLPKVSGLKVLESLRTRDALSNVPVIVMTSSNAPEDLEKCKELGVYSFVQKPLTFSSFAKAFADSFHARRDGASAREYSLNPAR